MRKLIEKNDFITVYEVTRAQVEINEKFVLEFINKYLEKTQIAGTAYKATELKIDNSLSVEISLERVNSEYMIDEDFESDEGWKQFTNDLAKKLKVRHVGVPYYYYPK